MKAAGDARAAANAKTAAEVPAAAYAKAEADANAAASEVIVTRGSPPSMSVLEQILGEIKSMYKEQFGHSVAEDVVEKDGIEFSITRGLPPS